MILEVADIRIRPGEQAGFDAAINRGTREVIGAAPGCRGYKVNRSLESPERYLLMKKGPTCVGPRSLRFSRAVRSEPTAAGSRSLR